MSRYPEHKQIDYSQAADEILSFWQKNDIFRKSVDARKGAPAFTFYEGPPSANGTPGIHHVMARTVKDIFCRYKTQKGYQVKRKGGWDAHGLPVELQVEKELGIKKDDIGTKISIEEYNAKCREAVMKFKDHWDDLTVKMGYWVDLKDPYITFEKDYIESLWSLLKELYNKGLLYKGYTVQPYSPAAGTGLSSHELNMPGTYRKVKDTSVVAQFKVKRDKRSAFLFEQDDEDVRILAWTTTPWTLPSNCALAVGKQIDYAKIKTFNAYTHRPVSVVMAKELIDKYFNRKAAHLALEDYRVGDKLIPFAVGSAFPGTQLLEVRYEQLMNYITGEELEKNGFRVIAADFVSTEEGTGVVHTASLFGADDLRVTRQAGVPPVVVNDENGQPVPLVNKQGKFVDEVADFAGRYVREEYYDEETRKQPHFKPTDVLIAIKLKEENKAFRVEKYEHNYPHCWRTDKPVLYYPLDSWFVKTTKLRDRMIGLNKTINWKPAATGTGRFGNWLENLVDWNLSRSRYWGTPLPIWMTEDKREVKCIGSIGELKAEVRKSVAAGLMNAEIDDDFDPHRPYVDDVVLVSRSGAPMKREQDLVDVWFDSGAMPYAQWHYPFENKRVFNESHPADFIAEGVDQTRGWFFTLHAISVLLHDKAAFKNVVSTGLVLDKNGNKMSKRLGNAINPFETLKTYGTDPTRWYMIANANPWDNLKFDTEGIVEVQRKLFGTLANTYAFFALYANIDGFDFNNRSLPKHKRTESDRWMLSRLNSLIKEADEAYEQYDATKAARAIRSFVIDDMSNWYVRLNRKRFWVGGEYSEDKEAAYQTLHTCLVTCAGLMAPIAPFYADKLYRDLHKANGTDNLISVHLSTFPKAEEADIDAELEQRMRLAQLASSLVHALRRKEKIKVRQPLTKIMIPVLSPEERARLALVEHLIITETNVKSIVYLDDDSGILIKKAKPNFRKLGARFGSKMKSAAAQIARLDQRAISTLERDRKLDIHLEGETVTLRPDDVEIASEDIPGWLVASEDGLTVALDITVTEELRKEGLAREMVNRVQNLRKDKGLEVQDKIAVAFSTTDALMVSAIEGHKGYIQRETQAVSLEARGGSNGETLMIDGINLMVGVEVVR